MRVYIVVILVACLSACKAEESTTEPTDVLSHLDSAQVEISAFPSNSSSIAPKRQKDFVQVNCATAKPAIVSPGVFALDATHAAPISSGFCRVYAKKSLTARNYEISVDLYNVYGDKSRNPNFGYPGVFYNAKDINNCDSLYFRLHYPQDCIETNQYVNGAANWKGDINEPCINGVPRGQTWFNVKVVVSDGRALIYRDDFLVASPVPFLFTRASGGILVANGYNNLAYFRNFKITSMD